MTQQKYSRLLHLGCYNFHLIVTDWVTFQNIMETLSRVKFSYREKTFEKRIKEFLFLFFCESRDSKEKTACRSKLWCLDRIFFLISFQLINLNFDMTLLNNLWSFVLENKKVSQKFSRNEINSRFIEVASFFCQISTWNRSSQIVQWVNISKKVFQKTPTLQIFCHFSDYGTWTAKNPSPTKS